MAVRDSSHFPNQSEAVKVLATNLVPSTTRFEEQNASEMGNVEMHDLDREIIEDSLEHMPE